MVRPEETRYDEIEWSGYLSCCDQICEHDPSSYGRRLQTNRDAEYSIMDVKIQESRL